MRILIVDDNPGTCNAFKIGLTSMGFEVSIATGGEEALRMLADTVGTSERPDLLLTDLRMPQMSGLELIHKARELRWDLPVILMTAYGEDGIKKTVMALQGCQYLDKPLTVGDLVKTIHTVYQQPCCRQWVPK